MTLPRWAYQLLLFATVLVHFYIAYYLQRTDTVFVLGCFGFLWLGFLIKWTDFRVSLKQMIALGMLFRLVYLLGIPELSDDVFRYIWDGLVLQTTLSPYGFTPTEWLNSYYGTEYPQLGFEQLYPLLNSPDYYSIYPPVLQVFFGFSALVGNGNVLGSIVTFRLMALAVELGSILLIWKLLRKWNMNTRNLMLYALNPLVIIEFVGNLHGEVFMVFFLLLSIWLLSQKRVWLSAFAFGLAVGVKLLPLIFLPFFIKRIGWWKSVAFGGVAVALTLLLFFPFWTPDLLSNFSSSVRLYFANFEFNASLYYLIREVGYWIKGYNIIADTAIWLPRIVLIAILGLAFFNKEKSLPSLPKMMLFSWCIYFALATTVHPWYITALAAFLPFVRLRFALVWMILIPLSYHAYGSIDYNETLWLVALGYVPVYAVFTAEMLGFRLKFMIAD